MAMSEPNRTSTTADPYTTSHENGTGHSQVAGVGSQDETEESAGQATGDARAKRARLAEGASQLAHRARDVATHPRRVSMRLVAVPLMVGAGVTAVVVNWVRYRRRQRNRIVQRLKRRLPAM